MKKKLLSLLTSLMLACSLAAFMPQQNSVNALESTQTQTVVQQNEHKVKGEVVAQEDGIKYVKLDNSIGKTCSDFSADTGINATPSSSFVALTGSKYGYTELGKYSSGSKRQSFYNAVYNICLSFWNQTIDNTLDDYDNYYIIRSVSFKNYGLSLNEALQTYNVLRHDNPSFYFLATRMIAYSDDYIAILMPKEYNGKSTRASMQNTIIKYADDLRAKIKDNYTNYYKALVLNNTLVNDLEYAHDSSGNVLEAEWAHNVYGAAYYKRCVCEGYAKTFQMVMNMSNVENVYVIGLGQGAGHAWNMVKLDNGSYYCYDSTWNDTARTKEFIARGTTFFNREHTPYDTTAKSIRFMYNIPSVPAADYNGTKEMYKTDISFTKQLTGVKYTTSYGRATLSWNVPAVASGVYVYQQIDGKYVQIAKLGKGIAAYNVQNLTAKSYYNFQLRTYYIYNGREYVSDKPSTVLFWTQELPSNAAEIVRYAGNNRYSTAVEISKANTQESDFVIIASGTSYADALAAVPLAYSIKAPILLSSKTSLDAGTIAEIQRRKAAYALIIGGTGVVSANVENQLKTIGVTSARVAGKDRFETSAKIAIMMELMTKTAKNTAFFVYYNDFADALSVSSIAAAGRLPILYIRGTGEIDQYTKSYLAAREEKLKYAFIIGGPKLISENAEKNLKAYSETQPRIYGSNRYMTNLYVNQVFSDMTSAPCLATGTAFPDALAGGVYAASNRSPIYLVPPTLIDEQVERFKKLKPEKIIVFGGTGAVTTQAAYQAAAAAAA